MSIASVLVLAGCKKDSNQRDAATVKVKVEHMSGVNPLILGTTSNTAPGDPIIINVFKYYLSNFSVVYDDFSEEKIAETYFLIDESNAASKNISFVMPEGNVKELRFWIGVDSTRNVSGVQTGALDPANAMFWTWNSGYIFAKMEGRSFVSPAPLQAVTYHIGGFRTGQNALRQVSIPFSTSLPITAGSNFTIVLRADAMKWFSGVSNVSIATESYTMEPGPLALKIADNYAKMFSLKEVTR